MKPGRFDTYSVKTIYLIRLHSTVGKFRKLGFIFQHCFLLKSAKISWSDSWTRHDEKKAKNIKI